MSRYKIWRYQTFHLLCTVCTGCSSEPSGSLPAALSMVHSWARRAFISACLSLRDGQAVQASLLIGLQGEANQQPPG